LGEELKDTRTVPTLAVHLLDAGLPASYRALDGLKNITHEEACTLPPEWKEQNIEPQHLTHQLLTSESTSPRSAFSALPTLIVEDSPDSGDFDDFVAVLE
jgi:hypothetical protein